MRRGKWTACPYWKIFFTDYSADGRGFAESSRWPIHQSVSFPPSDPKWLWKTWKAEGRRGKCQGCPKNLTPGSNLFFSLHRCKSGVASATGLGERAACGWSGPWVPRCRCRYPAPTWMLPASPSLRLSPVGQFSPEQVKRMIEPRGTGWFPRTTRRLYVLALIPYSRQPLVNEREVNVASSPWWTYTSAERGIRFFTCAGDWNIPEGMGITQ